MPRPSLLDEPLKRGDALGCIILVFGLWAFLYTPNQINNTLATHSVAASDLPTNSLRTAPQLDETSRSTGKTQIVIPEKMGHGCIPADNPFGLVVVDYKDSVTAKPLFKMAVFMNADIVSINIKQQGWWELTNLTAFSGMHSTPYTPRRGDTLLDVGGNIGTYSAVFAYHGFKVIAIEPMTANRAALTTTMCLNPHFDITVVPAAVGTEDDINKTCIIRSRASNNQGNGMLTCGTDHVHPCRSDEPISICESINSTTIDSVLSRLNVKSVDVVKVDVENFECRAMMGGPALLSKYKPKRIQVEHGDDGVTEKCLPPFMKERGFTREHFLEENEKPVPGIVNWIYGPVL